jgi:ABC-type lipoprotein release transport system permease subunit
LRGAVVWAESDIRRRWRSLLLLALLAGLTSALAMAAAAGARRTDTALTRLETTTNAMDAVVFASQSGDYNPNWTSLERRPEVAQLAPWDLMFGTSNGQPVIFFGSDDGRWLGTVDRPVVLSGHMFDPRSDDEMVVDEQVAAVEHLRVGDVVPFVAYAPDQPDTSGPALGARVDLHITGIVRDVDEYLFSPGALVSPGVIAHYRSDMLLLDNAMVRLQHGEADMAALRRDANALVAPGVPVLDLHSASRRVTTTLAVERLSLSMLAAAIAVAGGLLVAQVLLRSASLVGQDTGALRAMGMTRRDVATATVLSHVPTVVGAAVVAGVGAVALSPLFPIGEARDIDPDVGVHADWLVLGIGLAVTLLVLVAATWIVGLLTARREVRYVERRSSAIATWLRRKGPLPVGLGAQMALERGSGARSVPTLPALVGAVVGVLGVVSALTVDHAIRTTLANPRLVGVSWGMTVTPPPDALTPTSVTPKLLAQVRQAARGSALAVVRRDVVDVNGVGVPAYSVLDDGQLSPPISFTTLSGRPPHAADEADIGPGTAELLGVHVGNWVTVAHRARVHIVGEALLPADVHSEFDEGLWLTPRELDALVPPNSPSSPDELVVVRFPATGGAESMALADAEYVQQYQNLPPGSNPDIRFVDALGGLNSPLGSNVNPPTIPLELVNLQNVELLPNLLGISLAALAIAALAYVLVVSGRSRRRDFAVLRAIGLDSAGTRLVVVSQAIIIAAVGLAVGLPLGVVVARWAWAGVADRVPLVYVPPFWLTVVLLSIPAFLLVATAVALWPARSVVRSRPAVVLRTE